MTDDLFTQLTDNPTMIVTVRASDLLSAFEACAASALRLAREAVEEPDRLISKDEAARMLGVSPTTLWRWEKAGYLSPVRIGVAVRYRMREINEMIYRKTVR
ncbi:MAG: helix-turn-helix domain-containing protein [Clostridia bacterium]|nr:helix-turn-helix domain-containing protein [Clostridia bacterium]